MDVHFCTLLQNIPEKFQIKYKHTEATIQVHNEHRDTVFQIHKPSVFSIHIKFI